MPVPGTTLSSLRPLIQGTSGVVVSSHPSASMIGLDILQRGGNAIDAGVAVGIALNVVHAHECNFLGVAPTVLYRADRREAVTIDGLGWWPKAASVEYFQQHHNGEMPGGILRVLTPGAADALITALARYGTMSFAEAAGPAIALAENGFPAYRFLVSAIKAAPDTYTRFPGNAEVFMPGGRAPEIGDLFYQKDLAATLWEIVGVENSHRANGRAEGLQAARDFIYKGPLAEKIVAYNRELGGLMTMEDLAAYHVRCDPPVHVHYKGYDVYGTGPWGQGPVFPQALKLLDGFDLQAMGHNSAEYLHTVIQALNLALADREQYIADPEFVDVPLDALLSDAYLGERRQLIDPQHAWTEMPPPGDPRAGKAVLNGAPLPVATTGMNLSNQESAGTSYFGVIDKDGNMFSCTPSEGAKSGPIIPGVGMAISLRGSQSKVQPGHPAALAPHKRPRLTPAPALVLRDGRPCMAFGGYGGDHIPQGTLQVFLNLIEFGLDPQEAVEAPGPILITFPIPPIPMPISQALCEPKGGSAPRRWLDSGSGGTRWKRYRIGGKAHVYTA